MKKILICLWLLVLSMAIIAQNSFSVKDAYCIDMEIGRVREDTTRFYLQDCFPNICHRYFYFTVDFELGFFKGNVVNDSIILSDIHIVPSAFQFKKNDVFKHCRRHLF